MDWLPIKDAPKDGTAIIVFLPREASLFKRGHDLIDRSQQVVSWRNPSGTPDRIGWYTAATDRIFESAVTHFQYLLPSPEQLPCDHDWVAPNNQIGKRGWCRNCGKSEL